ncbi:c-type cytochrome [Hoeflea poritis]|uniref:Cytochrome c n=1 Tax=Hoeflea poritis TaxID=2993659 RepID=A0ABT4VRV9_9HYPH|nr:cytochrome c [Hoeflea poritis]MDA4847409.1 cytochrome c [Hoeflea poritis]
MHPIRSLAIALAVVSVTCGGLALAHSGATGIVKQRMDAMKDIAAQMKLIGAMVKAERAYDAAAAAAAADIIVQHADAMLSLFPEGSNEHPSEALTIIWSDWDGFSRSARELSASATVLSETAVGTASAADITAPFAAVGKTCASCHEDYRKPR